MTPKYIFLSFCGSPYRLCRTTGSLSCIENHSERAADFNESLSIYDMLCCPTQSPSLYGIWESLSSLGGIIGAGHSNSTMLDCYGPAFSGRVSQLSEACRSLGGVEKNTGDVSFLLPVV